MIDERKKMVNHSKCNFVLMTISKRCLFGVFIFMLMPVTDDVLPNDAQSKISIEIWVEFRNWRNNWSGK